MRFTFDGAALTGLAGDTLASALLANGVHLAGRSFKYHRPRGIMAAGAEEPNALVTVDRGGGRETPNLRATQVELHDGLAATSQNRWPSLRHDAGAVAGLFAPLLAAGFYYKTFMAPRGFWARLYEPAIRAAAGLGRAPRQPDPDRYLSRYVHCDVLVIGAGPAGLAAARAASGGGRRVILCDEQAEPGGSLLHTNAPVEGKPAAAWLADTLAELARRDVLLLARTTAFGYFAQNFVGLVERVTDHRAEPEPRLPRERLWQVRAKEVVLATGAIERPLVFPENDRPGIMLAEAARIYLNRYGVRAGTRAVVATADDSAYQAALDLQSGGVVIAAIADLRAAPDDEAVSAARAAGIPVLPGTAVTGTLGRLRVRAVDLGRSDGGGERVECDLVLMAGGWTPSIHLFSQSRGQLHYDDGLGAFVPGTSVQRERSAGACRGTYDLAACLAEGYAAGGAAAHRAASTGGAGSGDGAASAGGPGSVGGVGGSGGEGPHPPRSARSPLPVPGRDNAGRVPSRQEPVSTLAPSDHQGQVVAGSNRPPDAAAIPPRHGEGGPAAGRWVGSAAAAVTDQPGAPVESGHGRAFVDFQNDVTAKDLKLALREGFRSIEHVKRYTTTGMATDQGKTSNMNALAIVAAARGKAIPEVGLTTFRMPYTPVTFGAIAGAARGDLFDPVRRTPIHDRAAEQGAVFEDVGLWKRARYFPQAGEDMPAAVARECRAVRTAAGIFDASTLGKIEIVGPDAAEFMNRLYTNAWTKLAPGRCRYGLMLTEAGFVMDDGVVGRLAPDRFHVTTTTGGAPRVLHHMEDYLQTEFPELKVWLTSITEQWAVIAVQGPRARDIIAPLCEGIDVTRTAMPHMSVREGRVAGVPARLFRVSFTGELGFEINVPAGHGRAVWEAVTAAGAPHGMVPYGTETMHVLRAEKGYIIVGQESDGTVIPSDLGLDWAIGKDKPDFVGKRSLARPDMVRSSRKQLVGLFADDPKLVLEEGAQIVADPAAPIPMPMLGHVTSAYWSEALQRGIALALVAGGRARKGERLFVPMPDRAIPVTVVEPVFYDSEGKRLDG